MHNQCSRLPEIALQTEEDIHPFVARAGETSLKNSAKMLQAFREIGVSESCFQPSSGYGYDDIGREKLDALYARVFRAEAALVRTQFVSGTHAIYKAITGVVRPGNEVVSAAGPLYNTLQHVLGIDGDSRSGIKEWGVSYREVSLGPGGAVDVEKLRGALNSRTKVVVIQRSRGYNDRPSLSVAEIGNIIAQVKEFDQRIICLVDNCYGEFVEDIEPTEVGADLMAGSLIKNPGGGIAPSGGYVAGRKELVEQVTSALAAPGLGMLMGANLCSLRDVYQGFFLAPHIVSQAVSAGLFASRLFSLLGFEVSPEYDQPRSDIVQAVKMGTAERLSAFCRFVQAVSPVDSHLAPEAALLPGYRDPIVMAAGTFIQGSSIEFSADGPMKPPFWAFVQGGLTFEYSRQCLLEVAQRLCENGFVEKD